MKGKKYKTLHRIGLKLLTLIIISFFIMLFWNNLIVDISLVTEISFFQAMLLRFFYNVLSINISDKEYNKILND